jgi:hypothetical protein
LTLHQIENERAGGGKSNDSTEGGGNSLYGPFPAWENSKLTPAIFSVREGCRLHGGGGR